MLANRLYEVDKGEYSGSHSKSASADPNQLNLPRKYTNQFFVSNFLLDIYDKSVESKLDQNVNYRLNHK